MAIYVLYYIQVAHKNVIFPTSIQPKSASRRLDPIPTNTPHQTLRATPTPTWRCACPAALSCFACRCARTLAAPRPVAPIREQLDMHARKIDVQGLTASTPVLLATAATKCYYTIVYMYCSTIVLFLPLEWRQNNRFRTIIVDAGKRGAD